MNRPAYRASRQPAKPSAVSWALRQTCGSASQKLVLIAMANLADDMRECFPGARYLSEVTEQPESDVREAIASLRGIGLIAETGRKGGGNGRTAIYRLAVDGPVTEPDGHFA